MPPHQVSILLQYIHELTAHLRGVNTYHDLIRSIIFTEFWASTRVAGSASNFTLQYRYSAFFPTSWRSIRLHLDAGIYFKTCLDAGVRMFTKSAVPPYSGCRRREKLSPTHWWPQMALCFPATDPSKDIDMTSFFYITWDSTMAFATIPHQWHSIFCVRRCSSSSPQQTLSFNLVPEWITKLCTCAISTLNNWLRTSVQWCYKYVKQIVVGTLREFVFRIQTAHIKWIFDCVLNIFQVEETHIFELILKISD